MCGGGSGDQEQGFLFRMFADFDIHQMQEFLEQELILWDPTQSSYVKWDPSTEDYRPVPTDSSRLPIQRNIAVYTLLFHASPHNPEANFIFPPLGPYQSSTIQRFDPLDERDRKAALASSYCQQGCDFTLRLTRAGQANYYLVRGRWNPTTSPSSKRHLLRVP